MNYARFFLPVLAIALFAGALSLPQDTHAVASVLLKPANNLTLLGYWPLNEGTTTATGDFSGYGSTGTLTSSPTWTNGKLGKALMFDGANAYVATTLVTNPAQMTISAWIFPRTAGESGKGVVIGNSMYSLGMCTNDPGYCSGINNALLFYYAYTTTDGAWISPTSALTLNAWNHVVLTYDDTSTANDPVMYINGVQVAITEVGTPVGVPGTPSIGLNLGAFDASSSFNFDGAIDDVRIYGRLLNAANVTALYRGGAGRMNSSSKALTTGTTLTSGLTGLWTFDGADVRWSSATAGNALDGSGNNRSLTLTNMNRATTPTTGKLGQGLFIDGVNDMLATALNFSTFVTTSAATIALWIKPMGASPVSSDGENGAQMLVTDDSDDMYIGRGVFGGNDRIFVANFDGNYDLIQIPYTTGDWVHIVLVHSGGFLSAYKNGVLVSSIASGNTSTLAQQLEIADGPIGLPFNGTMDEVRLYNRGLTALEVQELYQLGAVKIHH